jgi:hypothetical protein
MTEYTDDVERTRRALTRPGLTTLVAIADGERAESGSRAERAARAVVPGFSA